MHIYNVSALSKTFMVRSIVNFLIIKKKWLHIFSDWLLTCFVQVEIRESGVHVYIAIT